MISTPSDDSRADVLHVVPEGRQGRRVRVTLGDSAFVTSKDVMKSLGLDHGDKPPSEPLHALVSAVEPDVAFERSLRLLGYRERSARELSRKLAEDGYEAEVIEHVLERLSGLSLLDDTRFAETFVRTKRTAGWGRRRIAEGLRMAGVDDAVRDSALDEHCPADEERERAARLVRPDAGRRDREKAIRRLVSRGYSWGDARAVIDEAWSDET